MSEEKPLHIADLTDEDIVSFFRRAVVELGNIADKKQEMLIVTCANFLIAECVKFNATHSEIHQDNFCVKGESKGDWVVKIERKP